MDLLGDDWKMTSDGSKTYQTNIGAVLSIIIVISLGFLTYTVTSEYFDTTNPHVNISTRIERKFPARHLYNEVYPLAVSVFIGANQHIPVEDVFKYVTPKLEIAQIEIDSEIEKGIVGFDLPNIFDFKPCKDIVDRTLVRDFMENNPNQNQREFFEKYMLCPEITDPDAVYTLSNVMSLPFRKVDIKIYPCTLANPADCINTVADLASLTVKYAETNKNFVIKNKFNDLITTSVVYHDIKLNPSKETIVKVHMKGNFLLNDDQDFSDAQEVATFLSGNNKIFQ
jgi:hypothetical protein